MQKAVITKKMCETEHKSLFFCFCFRIGRKGCGNHLQTVNFSGCSGIDDEVLACLATAQKNGAGSLASPLPGAQTESSSGSSASSSDSEEGDGSFRQEYCAQCSVPLSGGRLVSECPAAAPAPCNQGRNQCCKFLQTFSKVEEKSAASNCDNDSSLKSKMAARSACLACCQRNTRTRVGSGDVEPIENCGVQGVVTKRTVSPGDLIGYHQGAPPLQHLDLSGCLQVSDYGIW